MKTTDFSSILRENDYPGRGILLGRSPDGSKAVMVYFIMGRSENSRNRVFTATDDGIRTEAYDPSKMVDPSLIIYHPVRAIDGKTIVTNGDQTDTVRDFIARGECFRAALMTREFEPDAPNFTPRISGLVSPNGDYRLSILKSADGDAASCRRYFFEYANPKAGQGHFIHTYLGDGNPLPSFEGEPEQVAVTAPDAKAMAALVWESLNRDNKVSLFVRYLDLATGKTDDVIVNKHN
ncbi:MAG: IMP cyclohydrolase [Oscillospiraceae bacterium]|nr:IMP cyclohydrolase [Oscillospiraceae bacterium]